MKLELTYNKETDRYTICFDVSRREVEKTGYRDLKKSDAFIVLQSLHEIGVHWDEPLGDYHLIK